VIRNLDKLFQIVFYEIVLLICRTGRISREFLLGVPGRDSVPDNPRIGSNHKRSFRNGDKKLDRFKRLDDALR